ncbi:sulfotransferase family protein [Actinokineospora sp. NBRC 105648]|uniref:sulfotransferase family protein n=1 Tax=Actinokineospora sp. NBRC 105648 TaxID=3032206 RepID=UPI0024A03D20|nr:sulfotransferase family protein [Actinokineospora sp. NBRC 105648]GLZ41830.1 sulfotransferase family protein [Actinokineospora sp. NBRC 105648]
MKVIGAGLGRTGTASVKAALERLGLGPCYHMFEVTEHPGHGERWLAGLAGEPVDWAALYDGFQSTMDWPGCAFWAELVERYPEAKVVLTERDPQSWYDSLARTLLPVWRIAADPERAARVPGYEWYGQLVTAISARSFGGRTDDREHMVAAFTAHNAAVRAGVPADRLLVYQVGQGWAPLCEFLGAPVPDEPFPHLNDTASFQSMVERLLTA